MAWGPDCCTVCGAANQNRHRGDTYVMQYANTVKIGISVDVVGRVEELSKGNNRTRSPWDGYTALSLVCLFAGDIEHNLHEALSEAHLMGEWFHAEPVLHELPRLIAQNHYQMLPLPCVCTDCIHQHRKSKRKEYQWVTPTACEWWGTNPGLLDPKCKRTPVASVQRLSFTSTRKRWIAVCAIHAKQARSPQPMRKRRRRVYETKNTVAESGLRFD